MCKKKQVVLIEPLDVYMYLPTYKCLSTDDTNAPVIQLQINTEPQLFRYDTICYVYRRERHKSSRELAFRWRPLDVY